MKAILYVGGALMVAASIYGFIDYKKSSHDKSFNRLYNNKEVRASKTNDELNSAKEEPVKVADSKIQKAVVSEEETNKELKTNSSAEKKPVIKKKRKVTFEKFSRAKLDDKEEEIKIEPKKEAIKVEKKDQ